MTTKTHKKPAECHKMTVKEKLAYGHAIAHARDVICAPKTVLPELVKTAITLRSGIAWETFKRANVETQGMYLDPVWKDITKGIKGVSEASLATYKTHVKDALGLRKKKSGNPNRGKGSRSPKSTDKKPEAKQPEVSSDTFNRQGFKDYVKHVASMHGIETVISVFKEIEQEMTGHSRVKAALSKAEEKKSKAA